MSDNHTQSSSHSREQTQHTEKEEDIWDLEDNQELEEDWETSEDLAEEPQPLTDNSGNSDNSSNAGTPDVAPLAHPTTKNQAPEFQKNKGLSLIEKITLFVLCLAFLGLAASGYTWLYKKNAPDNPYAVELPFTGEHIRIEEFSTCWKSAKPGFEIKSGAKVLPSATLTLPSGGSQSGALRVYFTTPQNETAGDPISLTVNQGVFSPTTEPNVVISNDGLTADITSSDGFHQEGEFSAYLLDKKLAWKLLIFEAASPDSKWDDFKKIASPKIEPLRK